MKYTKPQARRIVRALTEMGRMRQQMEALKPYSEKLWEEVDAVFSKGKQLAEEAPKGV